MAAVEEQVQPVTTESEKSSEEPEKTTETTASEEKMETDESVKEVNGEGSHVETIEEEKKTEAEEEKKEEETKEAEEKIEEEKKTETEEEEEKKEEETKEAEEKKEEEKKTETEGEKKEGQTKETNEEKGEHGTTVAKHYNEHPEGTKESRKESRIFFMRNFNNWLKSVVIGDYLQKIKRFNYKNIHVLDMCSGKGGDLLKWQRGRIRKLVCADIAEVSVTQCEERYKEMQKQAEERRYRDKIFDTQFIAADCSKERLADKYEDPEILFDLTSCQFSYHYSFESYEQADMMLKNACERLKPGGYFVGTMPNAYELVNRLKQVEDLEYGNSVYKITFENREDFPLFGSKYNFHLEGVVDCPEFLVYFPVLEKMAEKYHMKLEYMKTFHDFFQEKSGETMGLLHRMNALETYPKQEGDVVVTDAEDQYVHAKDFIEGLQSGKDKSTESHSSKYRDHREKTQNAVGTLSKDEWEAIDIDSERRKEAEEAAAKAALEKAALEKAAEEAKKKDEEKSQEEASEPEPAAPGTEEVVPQVEVESSGSGDVGESGGQPGPEENAGESRKRKHEEEEEEAEGEPEAKKQEEDQGE